MTLREQLILTVVDKGMIGIILAMLGYFLSKALETFKSERALNNEFDKQRVLKVADLWEKLYLCEEEVIFLSRHIEFHANSELPDEEKRRELSSFGEPSLALVDRLKEMRRVISQNRFWLGDLLFARFSDYQRLLIGRMGLLMDHPAEVESEEEFVSKLTALQQSIRNYCSATPFASER